MAVLFMLIVGGVLAPVFVAAILSVRWSLQLGVHGTCQKELNPATDGSIFRVLLDPSESGGMNQLLARFTDRPSECTIQGDTLFCDIDDVLTRIHA